MTATIITKTITYILSESTTTENKHSGVVTIRLDPEEKILLQLCYNYNVFIFIKINTLKIY